MAAPEEQIVFLQEWFTAQGKKQQALITELGWPPQKANRIWHRLQPLRDGEIKEIADLLNVRAYEMLMHPDNAMRLRRVEAVIAEVPRVEPPKVARDEVMETKPRGGRRSGAGG